MSRKTRSTMQRIKPRNPPNPQKAKPANWIVVTVDTLADEVQKLQVKGWDYRIIVAESAACSVCNQNLSNANITAPNALLGHTRRGIKCQQNCSTNKIQLLGLKKASSNPQALKGVHLWESLDFLSNLNEEDFPDKAAWMARIQPPALPFSDFTLAPTPAILPRNKHRAVGDISTEEDMNCDDEPIQTDDQWEASVASSQDNNIPSQSELVYQRSNYASRSFERHRRRSYSTPEIPGACQHPSDIVKSSINAYGSSATMQTAGSSPHPIQNQEYPLGDQWLPPQITIDINDDTSVFRRRPPQTTRIERHPSRGPPVQRWGSEILSAKAGFAGMPNPGSSATTPSSWTSPSFTPPQTYYRIPPVSDESWNHAERPRNNDLLRTDAQNHLQLSFGSIPHASTSQEVLIGRQTSQADSNSADFWSGDILGDLPVPTLRLHEETSPRQTIGDQTVWNASNQPFNYWSAGASDSQDTPLFSVEGRFPDTSFLAPDTSNIEYSPVTLQIDPNLSYGGTHLQASGSTLLEGDTAQRHQPRALSGERRDMSIHGSGIRDYYASFTSSEDWSAVPIGYRRPSHTRSVSEPELDSSHNLVTSSLPSSNIGTTLSRGSPEVLINMLGAHRGSADTARRLASQYNSD